MAMDTTTYAEGTSLTSSYPWGWNLTAHALCSDGAVRKVKRISETADTFFSIPASVKVKGKTVAGYVTIECLSGSSVPSDDDPTVVKFVAYQYRTNHACLPQGAYRPTNDKDN